MTRLLSGIALLLPFAPAFAADVPSSPIGGLFQMFSGLGVVVALILGLAWLMRRAGPGGGTHRLLRVVASQSLGARERLTVVEIGDTWLLLGVAPGRVSRIGELPRPALAPADAPGEAKNTFAAWLDRAKGRASP